MLIKKMKVCVFPAFLQLFEATHMENGKKDEEGVNNEGHDVGKRSEGEGHPGDLVLL